MYVERTRPRAMPLATMTMKTQTHGFTNFPCSHETYGAPLCGPSGRLGAPLIIIVIRNFVALIRTFSVSFAPEKVKMSKIFVKLKSGRIKHHIEITIAAEYIYTDSAVRAGGEVKGAS